MFVLLLALACGEEEPSPLEDCQASGAECCVDADCGADEICFHTWTCTMNGCSEPEGDRQCHQLCADTGAQCDTLGEDCQTIDHVQGGDTIGSVVACF